jgi:hypothetical protein
MNWRIIDRLTLVFVAACWIWKLAEYGAREAGWLNRNLGWGFYVDFTIPVVATAALLSIMALRNIVRRLVR